MKAMLIGIILFCVGSLACLISVALASSKKGETWLVLRLIICGIGLMMVVASSVVMVGISKPKTELYPITAQVAELDRKNDIVTCVDGAGLFWEFTECDDWQEGDFVSLLMNDNGTPQMIYDDTIEMVRYAGTFEG